MARGGRAAAKSAEGVIARVARTLFRMGKTQGKRAPSAVRRAAAGQAKHPFDMIPPGARKRVLRPVPGKVRDGVEYTWRDEAGNVVRLRAHGRDPSAPPGSNASRGPVYRVQAGPYYIGRSGRRYRAQDLDPTSPHYNPKAANDTHIPWPGHIPPRWLE